MAEPLSQAWLLTEFTTRLSAAFEGMTMEKVAIECQAPAPSPPAGMFWRQPFAGLPGILWLHAGPADVTAIGGHVLAAAGLSPEDIENDPATVRSTYLELLGQAASGLAQAITGQLGREVTPQGGSEGSPISGGIQWARASILLSQGEAVIHVGLEGTFSEPATPPQAKPEPPKAAAAVAGAASGPASGAAAGTASAALSTSKTFDLLLDVELPVSISFGRAQVQLKDVLKLTTGSIVELNRAISEPAEVIVNNCVIARGEVVVVEGNFGVRIQHVISRQERLRTLY